MIIGVAAVIAMVALGSGAADMIEEQVKTAGHEPDHHLAGQLQRRRRPRAARGTSTRVDGSRRRGASRPAGGRVRRRESASTGQQLIYGSHELEHEHRRHERRSAGDSLVADDVRQLLHAGGRQVRRQSDRPGRQRLGQSLRRRRGPDGHDHSRPQPRVQGARRDGAQGRVPQAARTRTTRCFVALHDGHEEAVGSART